MSFIATSRTKPTEDELARVNFEDDNDLIGPNFAYDEED